MNNNTSDDAFGEGGAGGTSSGTTKETKTPQPRQIKADMSATSRQRQDKKNEYQRNRTAKAKLFDKEYAKAVERSFSSLGGSLAQGIAQGIGQGLGGTLGQNLGISLQAHHHFDKEYAQAVDRSFSSLGRSLAQGIAQGIGQSLGQTLSQNLGISLQAHYQQPQPQPHQLGPSYSSSQYQQQQQQQQQLGPSSSPHNTYHHHHQQQQQRYLLTSGSKNERSSLDDIEEQQLITRPSHDDLKDKTTAPFGQEGSTLGRSRAQSSNESVANESAVDDKKQSPPKVQPAREDIKEQSPPDSPCKSWSPTPYYPPPPIEYEPNNNYPDYGAEAPSMSNADLQCDIEEKIEAEAKYEQTMTKFESRRVLAEKDEELSKLKEELKKSKKLAEQESNKNKLLEQENAALKDKIQAAVGALVRED